MLVGGPVAWVTRPVGVVLLFLPILVFQGALSADDTSMRHAARPILALAVPGVALSLLATAAVASWEIGLPFAVALLLGAVLAITDTVSVLLAFRSVRVPHRLAAIMEGESLFNDGTALVLVGVAATVVLEGAADFAELGRHLLVAVIAGAILGTVFGMVGAFVLRHAPDQLTDAALPFRRPDGAAEVLGHHDVGGLLRPELRDLDVALLEDDLALLVPDHGRAGLPFDFVERVHSRQREVTREVEPRRCRRLRVGRLLRARLGIESNASFHVSSDQWRAHLPLQV